MSRLRQGYKGEVFRVSEMIILESGFCETNVAASYTRQVPPLRNVNRYLFVHWKLALAPF